MVNSVPQILGT